MKMSVRYLRGIAVLGMLLAAAGSALAQAADTISGPASAIGPDIVKVNDTRVILLGIDAPEANQTCAEAGAKLWNCADSAFAVLDQTVKQGDVTCVLSGNPDPFGRRNGVCKVGGQDVADVLIRQGLAIPYPHDPESRNYQADAAAAKAAKQGIYADGIKMIDPWVYRIAHNHSVLK